jgi:hypothetical protein
MKHECNPGCGLFEEQAGTAGNSSWPSFLDRIDSGLPAFFLPFLPFLPKKDRQVDAPNHDAKYRLEFGKRGRFTVRGYL